MGERMGQRMRKTKNQVKVGSLGRKIVEYRRRLARGVGVVLVLGAILSSGRAISERDVHAARAVQAPQASALATGLTPAQERLLALAPPADLVALVDLRRIFAETIPGLAERKIGGIDTLAVSLGALATAAGLNPANAREGVLALSLQGLQAGGVLLVGGLDLDLAKLEPLLRANQLASRRETRAGVDLLTILTPVQPVSLGPLVLSTEELTVAPLGDQRLALGNLSAVQALVERMSKPASTTSATPATPATPAGGRPKGDFLAALRLTRAASLIRFTLQLPDGLREEAATQGDLFRSLAQVETIRGELDLTRSLVLALEAVFPTRDPKEAAELNLGLKGLLNLARALLGSSGEPAASGRTSLNQVLDQIRFTLQGTDVLLRLTLPASFFEAMSRPAPSTGSRP